MLIKIIAKVRDLQWEMTINGETHKGEVLAQDATARIIIQKITKQSDAWARETQTAISGRRHAKRRRA